MTIADVEVSGVAAFLERLAAELRPLGIPTMRDRVVMTAS